MMKHILIADDHSLIRSGLRMLLRTMDTELAISEAWDAKTVMDTLKANPFDLVLLDIQMSATDPVMLMHWIQSNHPDTKVLIISQNPEDIYGRRYLQLGANGFINKTAADGDFIKAIKKVMDGDRYVSDALAQSMLQSIASGKPANPFDQLSQREFQVVMFLAKGYGLNEVSELLQTHYSTAHTHKKNAFKKLNIHDNKGLAELAGAYDMLS